MEGMKLMVEGEDEEERKIFHEHSHSTWNNDFSGDQIINWIGVNGFGATITCMRDRLPGNTKG